VVEIPDGLPEANIDPQRLAQVVGNLLSNAVKYTESGGVAVSAATGDGEIRIAVADTGPGIPPDEQRRVFEPFYRGQTPQRTTEGLGVGLSIARSLTDAHGGRLTLDSAPGRGSVFTIHLPHG
jgi:signal transduction histidine kinase